MALVSGQKVFDSPSTPDVVGVSDPVYAKMICERAIREQPAEKIAAQLRQFSIKRAMQMAGSIAVEGMGQKIGSIDSRLFYRWHQQYPGCWNDPEFVKKMLKDNEDLRAPGYNPQHRRRSRH